MTDAPARRLDHHFEGGELDPHASQVAHLTRARWVILLILFIYALYAGSFYWFSRFGFFLSRNDTAFLALAFCLVVLYNLSYQNASRRLSRFRYADHLQVFLDMLLVTVLVHFSGGAASWVWPLYLLVTIEAAYLLKRRGDIWFTWSVGAALFGGLLWCEHAGIIANLKMPFADPLLARDSGYLLLIWCWMTILNAAVSVIGFSLMTVSRGETSQLKESRQQLFAFLEHADDLIQLNAPDGRFLYANRAWLRALGYGKHDLAGLGLSDVVHGDSHAGFQQEFTRVLETGGTGAFDAVFLSREGDPINVEGNLSCSFRGNERDAVWSICRDVTLKKRADRELFRRAHHDVLTDLPNRQLFMDRLQQLRAMMHRMQRDMAVLYLDLDRFKSVNDTYGHDFGDKLLQEVARRLAKSVRETDTVARLGGDEFVIAIGNLRDREGAEKVAAKVLNALRSPCVIDGRDLRVNTSIGISMWPEDGRELDDLLKKADRALYSAKAQGRGCYRLYCDLEQEQEAAGLPGALGTPPECGSQGRAEGGEAAGR